MNLQIIGKYCLRVDPIGEGAKWRRSFGQESYSPFLLAFTEQVRERDLSTSSASTANIFTCRYLVTVLQGGDNWTRSHVPKFYGMDPSYALPDNVAIITFQVCMYFTLLNIFYLCYSLCSVFKKIRGTR